MDGVELDLICPCGYENFERIVVQRKPHPPIVTDFVACVGCKTMYFAPLRSLIESPRQPAPIIQPSPETSPGLKTWGGVRSVYTEHEQSPDELRSIKEAAARANKAKRKR